MSHLANLSVSAHVSAQPCARTISGVFQALSDKKFEIANAREWDFTAQKIWWYCAPCAS